MKRLTLLLILLASTAHASEIVCFDEGGTNRITSHIKSANTPDYSGRSDCLINPDLSSLSGVERKHWIQDTGVIREMTTGEKNALAAEESTALDTTLRASAKALYDGQQELGQAYRALVKVLIDEFNNVRQWQMDLKAQTALSVSLADFQARIALLDNQPDRTLAQAKTAIQNAIDNGDVDE